MIQLPACKMECIEADSLGVADDLEAVVDIANRRITYKKGLHPTRHDQNTIHEISHPLYAIIKPVIRNGASADDEEWFCDRVSEWFEAYLKLNNLLPDGYTLRFRDDLPGEGKE